MRIRILAPLLLLAACNGTEPVANDSAANVAAENAALDDETLDVSPDSLGAPNDATAAEADATLNER